MINFDLEGLKALVWHYATQEGIITPKTWEIIISEASGGTHIPGDKFMADAKKVKLGLNIKSSNKKFTKGYTQTFDLVQCRCPLDKTDNIGVEIIKTLVDKREQSFEEFNLDTMLDVVIIHNRIGDDYNVRLFVNEQPKYENFDFEWHGGHGYLNPDKTKKNWKSKWKMKRNKGNEGGWQTCLFIKHVFDYRNCVANFSVKCDNKYNISVEEVKRKYAKLQKK